MFLTNLLATVTTTIGQIGDIGNITVKYQWICNIIAGIINFAGDVGLGIILFTVILKLITLAPDIWSRVSMKKNALKMEAMKEDLEKLQKQYAKNKDLYQQKMMALYKKNGYSAFSACLPTIITLVFFFIVIGAFNSYSQVSEREVFVGMKDAYNGVIVREIEKDDTVFKKEDVIKDGEAVGYTDVIDIDKLLGKYDIKDCFVGSDGSYVIVTDSEKIQKLIAKYPKIADYVNDDGTIKIENTEFKSDVEDKVKKTLVEMAVTAEGKSKEQLISEGALRVEEDGSVSFVENFWNVCPVLKAKFENLKYTYTENGEQKEASFFGENGVVNYVEMINLSDFAQAKSEFIDESGDLVSGKVLNVVANAEIENIKVDARKAAADWYESKENKSRSVIFPWVKNIWASDCTWTTAIPANYTKFVQKLNSGKNSDAIRWNEENYNEITYDLSRYKQTGFKNGNGWFILVALSILAMAGSTFIMNKTQKTQMQLSSVEGDAGTAASTQKMMTWMMPIMFGVFSFIYSAAFSIYMVTNSLISTGSTILINLIVEKSFKNKAAKLEQEKIDNHKYGKMR